MNHWTQSTIKGGGNYPKSLTDKWMRALASGRYNDSNYITGVDAEEIFLSQCTNKFMTIIFSISKQLDNFFDTTVANDLPDVYNYATELSTNTDLTLTNARGKSTTAQGIVLQGTGGKIKILHWSYCISTITADTNTNADGVPIGQRIELTASSSSSSKTAIDLFIGSRVLKVIEVGQGYEGVVIPKTNEICPAYLRDGFLSIINGAISGLDVALTLPRCKNYIIPKYFITRMSYLSPLTMFYKILNKSWGNEKNGLIPSYSVVGVNAAYSSELLITAGIKAAQGITSFYGYDSIAVASSSSKITYGSYNEIDYLFPAEWLGFLDIKNLEIDASEILSKQKTLFLKNQFPGAYSSEDKLNQLNEFYKIITSGITSARMPIDNVTASIMSNTLDLPFYGHCEDVVSRWSNVNGIRFLPFSLTYGYETSDAVSSQYDIFDDTHNVYIKINV